MTGRRRSFAVVGNSASCERRPSEWTAVRSEAFREAMRLIPRKAPHTLMCNEVWAVAHQNANPRSLAVARYAEENRDPRAMDSGSPGESGDHFHPRAARIRLVIYAGVALSAIAYLLLGISSLLERLRIRA